MSNNKISSNYLNNTEKYFDSQKKLGEYNNNEDLSEIGIFNSLGGGKMKI